MKLAIFFCILGLIVTVSAECKDDNGKTYKDQETWKPEGTCVEATCKETNIFFKTCVPPPPIIIADLPKYVLKPQDFTKKYPECCEFYEKIE